MLGGRDWLLIAMLLVMAIDFFGLIGLAAESVLLPQEAAQANGSLDGSS